MVLTPQVLRTASWKEKTAFRVAIGSSNLRASPGLLFCGVFCRVLDFLTSLFDLLPGFFCRLIDFLAGALHFSCSRLTLQSERSLPTLP